MKIAIFQTIQAKAEWISHPLLIGLVNIMFKGFWVLLFFLKIFSFKI